MADSPPQAVSLLNQAALALRQERPGATELLLMVDRVAQAVAVATDPEELKKVRDGAGALAHYCRQRSEYAEVANLLLRCKVEAERRIGEYLRDTVRAGSHIRTRPRGISENQSCAFQRLAAIPANQFEVIIGRIVTSGAPVSTKAVLRAAQTFRPQPMDDVRASSAPGAEEPRPGGHGSDVSLAEWQARRDRGMEDDDVIALEPPIGVAVFREHFPNSMEREPDGIIFAVIVARRGADRGRLPSEAPVRLPPERSRAGVPNKKQPVVQADAAANILGGLLGGDNA